MSSTELLTPSEVANLAIGWEGGELLPSEGLTALEEQAESGNPYAQIRLALLNIAEDSVPLRNVQLAAVEHLMPRGAAVMSVLARVAAASPAGGVLPPMPKVAPLGVFLCVAGVSGSAKSSVSGLTELLLPDGWLEFVDRAEPRSGEGIVDHMWQKYVPNTGDGVTRAMGVSCQDRWHFIAEWDELGRMLAAGSGESSTLLATLRSAWSGDRLNTSVSRYTSQGNGRRPPLFGYQLTALACATMDPAGDLVTLDRDGDAQRWWFVMSDDDSPSDLDAFDYDPAFRLELKEWGPGTPEKMRGIDETTGLPPKATQTVVTFPDSVLKEARERKRLALSSSYTADPLYAHSFQIRMRYASAIAWVHGRPGNVKPGDWELAGECQLLCHAAAEIVTRHGKQRRADLEAARRSREAEVAAASRERVLDVDAACANREVVNAARRAQGLIDEEGMSAAVAAKQVCVGGPAQRFRDASGDTTKQFRAEVAARLVAPGREGGTA